MSEVAATEEEAADATEVETSPETEAAPEVEVAATEEVAEEVSWRFCQHLCFWVKQWLHRSCDWPFPHFSDHYLVQVAEEVASEEESAAEEVEASAEESSPQ